MKQKTTSIIEEQLQRLNRSPLFAISLSGKELSHSNFWAWLLEQKVEGNHQFIEVFIPNFYQKGCTFVSVEREKKHVDLKTKPMLLKYSLLKTKSSPFQQKNN